MKEESKERNKRRKEWQGMKVSKEEDDVYQRFPKDEGRKQGEKQKPEAIARAERSYKFIE